MIVVLHTALNESTAPATARSSRPSHTALTNPKRTTATPQIAMVITTTRPSRVERDSQPLLSAATTAPAPGAAYRYPRPCGPVLKVVAASTGNTARGRPKIIALRSMAYVPRMTRCRRTNAKPRRSAAHGESRWLDCGGRGGGGPTGRGGPGRSGSAAGGG